MSWFIIVLRHNTPGCLWVTRFCETAVLDVFWGHKIIFLKSRMMHKWRDSCLFQRVRTIWTLTGGWNRTRLTRLVPGFSHIVGTAAHLLCHVEGQLVLTRVIKVMVTHTFPHVCKRPENITQAVKWQDILHVHVKIPIFWKTSALPMQLLPPLTCMYSGGQTHV